MNKHKASNCLQRLFDIIKFYHIPGSLFVQNSFIADYQKKEKLKFYFKTAALNEQQKNFISLATRFFRTFRLAFCCNMFDLVPQLPSLKKFSFCIQKNVAVAIFNWRLQTKLLDDTISWQNFLFYCFLSFFSHNFLVEVALCSVGVRETEKLSYCELRRCSWLLPAVTPLSCQ